MAQKERELGNLESSELLSEGFIDKSRYASAFANLRKCMAEGGYGVSEPILNPGDGISFLFTYDSRGGDLAKMDRHSFDCEKRHWATVSSVFTNTNEQIMEEKVRLAAQECMEKLGHVVPDSARSYLAMVGTPLDEGSARQKHAEICITESIYRLHPEIKSVGLAW
ncbi:hypothetical protein BIU82_15360 [Arthrobacter sp. SW1]|uniref:hypothetical protein n=1 Tax=Arthrobacter sp. SW1 TaxID=1920889 RepID=UPI000877C644|nr:hypothetical protein [Arthrobacter sp. SW1]OFI39235.1 hypothetical protein BIU82_15360 [Arthrobacter sp. SW1]